MEKKERGSILIIEDDHVSQELLHDLLKDEYEVKLAGSYENALKILRVRKRPFHVAVVDIVLDNNPEHDQGFRLIEKLNKMGKNTNVIVVSGYADAGRMRRAFKDLDVFDYFEKSPSFDYKKFRKEVRKAVTDAERRRNPYVFVLMPFARRYLAIYEHVVKKEVESKGIGCIRADDFFEPRRIMDDVNRSIREAKFIIADLSGRNANVFYEIGLAHAIGQTVLLLTQSVEDVPPKLRELRQIVYKDTPEGGERLRKDLAKAIENLRERNYQLTPLFPNRKYKPSLGLCVALMPASDIEKSVYTNIIERVATDHHLDCKSHQSVFSTELIMDAIWNQLNKARVIIADLSGKDPDVFYLTGISHGLKKHVILLARNEEDIPFDLRGPAHIIYSDQTFGEGLESRDKLTKVLKQVLSGKLHTLERKITFPYI